MKAGFFSTDITPRVGVALYGFGAYINRNSKAIRDRLEARAAAFESGGNRVVVIGCDLCTTRCMFDAIHLERDLPECSDMVTREEGKPKKLLPYAAKRAIKIKKKELLAKLGR